MSTSQRWLGSPCPQERVSGPPKGLILAIRVGAVRRLAGRRGGPHDAALRDSRWRSPEPLPRRARARRVALRPRCPPLGRASAAVVRRRALLTRAGGGERPADGQRGFPPTRWRQPWQPPPREFSRSPVGGAERLRGTGRHPSHLGWLGVRLTGAMTIFAPFRGRFSPGKSRASLARVPPPPTLRGGADARSTESARISSASTAAQRMWRGCRTAAPRCRHCTRPWSWQRSRRRSRAG